MGTKNVPTLAGATIVVVCFILWLPRDLGIRHPQGGREFLWLIFSTAYRTFIVHSGTNELLGVAPARRVAKPRITRLEPRIQEIDKLDVRKKRQIMQLLDTLIANEKLRQKVEAKSA